MTTMSDSRVRVPHVVKGERVTGADCVHGREGERFATPELDLNSLVWPRSIPGPAFDVPVAEIIDVLVEVGNWLAKDPKGRLEEALVSARRTSALPAEVVDRSYQDLPKLFTRETMEFQIRTELGGPDVLDGWREITGAPSGRVHRIRAFPPRLVHIIAGNSPGVAAVSIVRGALVKGLNLIKLPSNDPLSAVAIARTMNEIDPDHPVTKHVAVAYWKGGDEAMESQICRTSRIDKITAWGGMASVKHIQKFLSPGIDLIALNPKLSMSMVG